jgi:hypothetical protein
MVKKYLSDVYFKKLILRVNKPAWWDVFHHHLTSNGSKSFVYPYGLRPLLMIVLTYELR